MDEMGSISGTLLCTKEAPEHRGFECHRSVYSLNSVLGHGAADSFLMALSYLQASFASHLLYKEGVTAECYVVASDEAGNWLAVLNQQVTEFRQKR